MHELSNIETRVPVFENERCCLLTGSRRYYRDTCRAGIGTKLREGRHIIGFGCQSSALQKKGDSMMALEFLQAPVDQAQVTQQCDQSCICPNCTWTQCNWELAVSEGASQCLPRSYSEQHLGT